ncbi:DUF4116 domain-containing protein [Roseibium sp. RKSG952]|uniref:DUF4116 domain-containing protein n=1 Tax=Roseibium sp. RKSG952 TaxID=2529384 RepID=UPI0034CDE805
MRQNGRALQDVPEDLRSPGMCLEAVRQEGITLRHVPEALRREEMCLEAVAL